MIWVPKIYMLKERAYIRSLPSVSIMNKFHYKYTRCYVLIVGLRYILHSLTSSALTQRRGPSPFFVEPAPSNGGIRKPVLTKTNDLHDTPRSNEKEH